MGSPQLAASPEAKDPSSAPALLCPPEILGDIFEKSLDYPAAIPTSFKQRFNFLFVCHWWYQVAVNTARLWTFLNGNVKSWPTFLIRSKSAPLHLHIHQLRNALPTYLATMFALQQRLETLHIVESWSSLSVLLELLCECDEDALSRLTSMKLAITTVITHSGAVERANIPDSFISRQFPSLQELELHDCGCDYQAAMFHTSTLRRLSITSYDAITSPSMGDLISILDDNAGLEYLRITPRTLVEDRQMVISPLPFLRTLVIEGKLFHVENFLLIFPISKDLEQVTIRFDLVDATFLMAAIPSLSVLHRGIVARKFRLDSRQASLEFDVYSDLGITKPYLSFNFQQSIYQQPSRIELHAVSTVIPCDSVTVLEIRGDHHPPDECAALLHHMSTVDQLQIFEDCALTVVKVLLPHQEVAPTGDTLSLPVLKKLWLDGINFSTIVENRSFFEELSGCIRHRRQAGAELESLVLRGCNIRVEDLDYLREIVGEVDVRDGNLCIAPEDPVFVISME